MGILRKQDKKLDNTCDFNKTIEKEKVAFKKYNK